jgi:hypothetical protein
MRRPYLPFFALGIVFIGLAASGRSNVYYGVPLPSSLLHSLADAEWEINSLSTTSQST